MNQLLSTLLWTLFGFVLGALPFSVWVGKLVLGKDIRQFGDKNPGATN
ncbi:MAG: glycerol-3-phosphate acyltransferase, partial [Anaerolineales bacterium]|nr:glycerol-3-phosphate acyltransferase [Anaerolineales bacterium]